MQMRQMMRLVQREISEAARNIPDLTDTLNSNRAFNEQELGSLELYTFNPSISGSMDFKPIQNGDDLLDFIDQMQPRLLENAVEKYPMCCICYGQFKGGDQLRVLPVCKHPFHANCIDKWLLEFKGVCPIDKRCVRTQE